MYVSHVVRVKQKRSETLTTEAREISPNVTGSCELSALAEILSGLVSANGSESGRNF